MTLKSHTFLNNIETNIDDKMKDGFYHDIFEDRVGVYTYLYKKNIF